MKQQHTLKNESGFSAIELLVTIIIGTIFTISFYQMFMTVNQSSSDARNRAKASDIAYANLRRYASAGVTPNTWSPKFTCSTASGSSNTNDVVYNSAATGSVLTSGSMTSVDAGLPAPVTYSVQALAIFGCRTSDGNDGKPIRVDSTVTYGPANTVVRHTTLVGY